MDFLRIGLMCVVKELFFRVNSRLVANEIHPFPKFSFSIFFASLISIYATSCAADNTSIVRETCSIPRTFNFQSISS